MADAARSRQGAGSRRANCRLTLDGGRTAIDPAASLFRPAMLIAIRPQVVRYPAAMPEREAPSGPAGPVEPAGDASTVPDTPVPDPPAPILEMRGISKAFGATQALDDVSLELIPGEIHALLGENGAGKSTLIKIMTGVQQPDVGEILIDGEPRRLNSAFDAQTYAVAAIYQEPMIFPDLSVAENIFIGHRDRGRIVDRRRMRARGGGGAGAPRRPAGRRRAGARPDARRSSRPSRSRRRSRSTSAS